MSGNKHDRSFKEVPLASQLSHPLHRLDLTLPLRSPNFDPDSLIISVADKLVRHIDEFVSQKPGESSYVYRLPEQFRWPAMCEIVETHLRECGATASYYDADGHSFVVRIAELITDARERVADAQRSAPLHDGLPMAPAIGATV